MGEIRLKNLTKKTTDFLLIKFIKGADLSQKVKDVELRKKYAYLEAYISIIGNFLLAGIKVFLGIMLNSISLLADAVHTASDVITSLVVLLGFKISSTPADKKHPYGHGRIEFLMTLLISAMLIYVGVKFGISSYDRFIENAKVKGSIAVAVVMVFAGIFKEWMAQVSVDLGERTNSPALIADAWHHRTDAIASVLVAIAIVFSMYGYYKVDAILGFLVSALIVYTGIELALSSASKLIGEIPDEEEIKAIEKYAFSVPGVADVHKIRVHDYGVRKEISLHIKVDHELNIVDAHDISEEVEKIIEDNIYSKAVVHIEPLKSSGTY